jgi:hypothetical protein
MDLFFSIIFLLALLGVIAYGWRTPGHLAGASVSFLVMEQIFAYNFPGIFYSNTRAPDFLIGTYVLIVAFKSGRLRPSSVPLGLWLAALLVVYAGLSTYWAPRPALSQEIYLKCIGLTVLVSILGPLCITTRSDIKAFISSTFLLAVTSAAVFASGSRLTRSLAVETSAGVSELQPLSAAQLSGYGLIIGVFILSFNRKINLKYLLVTLAIPLFLYVIVASGSRGQLLALAPVLLVWLPYSQNRSSIGSWFLVYCITSIVVYLAYNFAFTSDIAWRWDADLLQEGSSFRVNKSLKLLQHFLSEPEAWVFGLGSSASYLIIHGYCHVVPIEILCELGILGFATYFAIYSFAVAGILKTARAQRKTLEGHQISIIAGLMLYELLIGLKQGSFLSGYVFTGTSLVIMATSALKASRNTSNLARYGNVPIPSYTKSGRSDAGGLSPLLNKTSK